jgi:glycosyltransferase involved in cell wall biosynthesis
MYNWNIREVDRMPIVSVIMNCLNCEKYLKEAIDSVYGQTFTDWEIIFWDNNSTDSSAAISKSYDSKLRYFKGEETILLGAARNEALKQCKGEYIAFLDCDDIWDKEKLFNQMNLMREETNIGLVYSNFINMYPNGDKIPGDKFFSFKRGYVFKSLLKNNFIVLSTTIILKSIIKEFDCFPEYVYAEEYDLFLKIANKYKIEFVDKPMVFYRYHDNNESFKRLDNQLNECTEIYNYWSSKSKDPEIKKICYSAIGYTHYGIGRRLLLHLNESTKARMFFKNALKFEKRLVFVLFLLSTYIPNQLLQHIRRLVLRLKRL